MNNKSVFDHISRSTEKRKEKKKRNEKQKNKNIFGQNGKKTQLNFREK